MKVRLTFTQMFLAPADTQQDNPVNVTITGNKENVENLVTNIRRFYEEENARMKKEHEDKEYEIEWVEQ